MRRLKLLATTLPVVAGVLVLVLLRDEVFGVDALLAFDDLGPILTGTAVLLGFMLAGVIADYKESERLPARLASVLMGVEDSFAAAQEAGQAVDLERVRTLHASITLTVTEWLLNRASHESCLSAVASLNTITGIFDRAGAGAYVVGLSMTTQELRGLVTRLETIRRTMFVPVGYVLLYLLVGVTLLLLIFGGFEDTTVQYLVVGSVTLIYVYLVLLIHDLDNPFDYAPSGEARGTAEIDPAPLVTYCQIVQRAVAPAGPPQSSTSTPQ